MDNKIHLEIVTPDRNFYENDVKMFVIETSEGEIGVLNDHEPLVTPVSIGEVWIEEKAGDEKVAACSKGFLTIADNVARVVVDSAEWEDEIDIERAEEARKRAEKRLEKRHDEIDVVRAKASLERAINRLRVKNR